MRNSVSFWIWVLTKKTDHVTSYETSLQTRNISIGYFLQKYVSYSDFTSRVKPKMKLSYISVIVVVYTHNITWRVCIFKVFCFIAVTDSVTDLKYFCNVLLFPISDRP